MFFSVSTQATATTLLKSTTWLTKETVTTARPGTDAFLPTVQSTVASIGNY